LVSSYKYSAFAWTIESNLRIPDLLPAHSDKKADLHVRLGEMPQGAVVRDGQPETAHSATSMDGRPHWVMWQIPGTPYSALDYFDGHRFVFNDTGTEVWAEWPSGSTLEDNLCYLLGPVMGIVLSQRAVTCLHASCVQIGDGCVAIVGGAEAGKSTTAAAFALRGNGILSDDITTVEKAAGEIVVRPAYPRIRLWPDSSDVLRVPLETLPPLTPSWDKRYLDLRGERLHFAAGPLPLRAVYILQQRAEEAERPYLRPVGPREAFVALLANLYAVQSTGDKREDRDFPILGEVARLIPVHAVFPHSDAARLPDLCDLIEQHATRQSAGAEQVRHV
jgi:hypothetical protein